MKSVLYVTVLVAASLIGGCAGTVGSHTEATSSQDALESFHRVEDAYRRVDRYEDTGMVRTWSVQGAQGSATFTTKFVRMNDHLEFSYTADSAGTVTLTTLADGRVEIQDEDGSKSVRPADGALVELAGVTMATSRLVPMLLRGGRLATGADTKVASLGVQEFDGVRLVGLALQGRSDRRLTLWVEPATNMIRRAEFRAVGAEGELSSPRVLVEYHAHTVPAK